MGEGKFEISRAYFYFQIPRGSGEVLLKKRTPEG